MKTEILYEDKDVLVAYKPAGLAAQTARVGQQDMVSELKNYLQRKNSQQENSRKKRVDGKTGREHSAPYLGVVHRLDQPVEGLLVFAKNSGSASALTKQLQSQDETGMFHKHYYGVLWGRPAEEEGELVDYLYKNKDNMAVIMEAAGISAVSGRAVSPETEYELFGKPYDGRGRKLREVPETDAKKAVLQYRILQTVNQPEGQWGELALADIRILTGRFHQIRAQMAHAGTPLVGDIKYGSEDSKAVSRRLDIRNVALCAYSLEFVHPVTGERMHFRTEPRGKVFSFFFQS